MQSVSDDMGRRSLVFGIFCVSFCLPGLVVRITWILWCSALDIFMDAL